MLRAVGMLSILCHPHTEICYPFFMDYVPHGAAVAQKLARLGAMETNKPIATASDSLRT